MSDALTLQYKYLWAEIFGDKEDFIEKYFELFVNAESLYHLSDKKGIVSALTACSYQWNYFETPLPFAYLSGILTRTDARSKGCCANLIKTTLNDLFDRHYVLSGLIAADLHLVNYYSKLGFVHLQDTEEEIFHRINANTRLIDNYFLIKDTDICAENYKWFVSHRDNAVKHTKQTLKLYNSPEYKRFAVVYDGTVRAVCVGTKSKYFIEIADIHSVNAEGRTALLSLLCKTFKRDIKILAKKNRMLRIVDAKKMLMLYAENHFNETFNIHICDDIIEENNITVAIHNGKVTDIDNSYKIPSVKIEDLTQQLFPTGDLFLMYEV